MPNWDKVHRRHLIAAASLLLAGTLAAPAALAKSKKGQPAPAPAPDIRTRPFAFTATDLKDSAFTEPSVALTRNDAVLFCGPNRPTNAYIRTANWVDTHRSDVGLAGGSDCDVKVGRDNAVYMADLQIVGTEVLKSVNDGRTFDQTARTEDPIEQDRQWLAPDPNDENVLYLAFHDFASEQEVVAKSVDGGRTFVQHSVASSDPNLAADTGVNTYSGPVRVDPTNSNRVAVAYGISTAQDNTAACNPDTACFGDPKSVVVAVSNNGGLTWTDHKVLTVGGKSSLGNLFPWLTVDRAGNFYALAAEAGTDANGKPTNGVLYSSSTDGGATWSPAKRVNAGPGATVFPTAIGGKAGVLDVAWLESSATSQTDGNADWSLHFAQSRNATAAVPTFTETAGPVVRHGLVCTLGILCNGGRDLGDFMEVALDSFGYAHVASTSTMGPKHVVWWRQDAGPSATSDACTAASPQPCTVVTTRPTPPPTDS